MLTYTVRPITDRTPFRGDDYATASQFKVSWSTAEQLLAREVDFIGGREVVVELDVAERDIRRDGYLRASYRAQSGAVRFHVVTDSGPLQFATDEFRPGWTGDGRMKEAWQHNLYAIARGLEALRAVDRYGISRGAEQYRGYLALPPGGTALGETTGMTREDAIRVVLEYAGHIEPAAATVPEVSSLYLADAYRAARRRVHPDRVKDDSKWNHLEYAARVALGLIS